MSKRRKQNVERLYDVTLCRQGDRQIDREREREKIAPRIIILNMSSSVVFVFVCFWSTHSRPTVDRTGRRHPAEERAKSRGETSAGKTMRVPKPGAQVVRVLPEDEPAIPGLDHVSR